MSLFFLIERKCNNCTRRSTIIAFEFTFNLKSKLWKIATTLMMLSIIPSDIQSVFQAFLVSSFSCLAAVSAPPEGQRSCTHKYILDCAIQAGGTAAISLWGEKEKEILTCFFFRTSWASSALPVFPNDFDAAFNTVRENGPFTKPEGGVCPLFKR